MPFSQGSRSGFSLQAETTFGGTPGVPTLIQLPYTTHSLNLTKDRVQGNDILPDRIPRVDRHGNKKVSGDLVVDLRKGDYDALLESVFMSTFATNVLKVGTTFKSFHMEDAAVDIAQYRLFKGVSVGSLSVSIKPNQMVTGTFSLIGKDMTISGTSFDASKTAASGNQPFDAYSGTMKVADAGGSLASIATITGIDFSINNSFNPTFVVGSDSTPQIEFGLATVEGTVTAYFEDATLINRFLNETETALEVSVDDPTGASDYTWFFPRVKFNGADVPVSGPTSRVVSIPFVALYDATAATNIRLTRST